SPEPQRRSWRPPVLRSRGWRASGGPCVRGRRHRLGRFTRTNDFRAQARRVERGLWIVLAPLGARQRRQAVRFERGIALEELAMDHSELWLRQLTRAQKLAAPPHRLDVAAAADVREQRGQLRLDPTLRVERLTFALTAGVGGGGPCGLLAFFGEREVRQRDQEHVAPSDRAAAQVVVAVEHP